MTNEPIPTGAMARVIEDHQGLDKYYYKGETFIVEQYVSAEENTELEAPGAYYMGSTSDGYFNVEIDADKVELAMSTEDVQNRKLPSLDEVASKVQDAVMGLYSNDFSVHTGNWDSDGNLSFEATTTHGLEFVFDVTVKNVESTSW